ncbi:hypothetical protein [Pseudomonas aeruginosa]|uniref:hypothetical protein n=1 Tax=Pseudomonas aeruginosa TaxID=287 RepID=UPI000BB8028E|nr:hypothetical protein [Pseudomonas aeruginosa]MBV5536295.1 hypothetical protein [Pseudomonas aeruginosa]PBW17885.1 hypothetical protein CJU17_16125 [Pseudomonas aeruginosa]PBW23518.1 hypothetical protein CJU16_18290 [Pseudomonas aeruginosa]PBW30323.1 hypothetical protein CJU14_13610 [Pseudomonas aeruginosa]PCA60590.1 hypothetical protein CJU15_12245 [Pseudomonas aeruginosa]
MTTPISDEQLAEIERDILAQAQTMSGQCEGGVWLRGGDCPKCQATRHDRCQFPLSQSYAIPSNVEALIARLRAAEADAKRYRWLRDKSADADGVYPMVSLTDDCGDQVSNWLFGKAVDKAVDEAMESTP